MRRSLFAALVGLAALLLITACGSDDEPTGSEADRSTTIGDESASDAPVTSVDEEPTSSVSDEASAEDTTDPTEQGGDPEGAATGDGTDEGTDEGTDKTAEATPPVSPDELPLPTTPAELTAAISEAELALRQPGIDEPMAAPWGRRQQALYRVLGFNPEWADEVLAGVNPSVQGAVARNWEANRALLALVRSHTISDTLPAWRIEPPPPADELLAYYREAEAATGVPWSILAAINLIETRMGRIQGISTAGAVGPMQFLPTTWAECCDGDPTNPRDAINGAGRYLVQRGAERDLNRAIFGYNNSDNYVTGVTSFAAVLDEEPELYYGYHAWQVYFLSTEGVIVLPEGYEQTEPIAATAWLAAHPESLFPAP